MIRKTSFEHACRRSSKASNHACVRAHGDSCGICADESPPHRFGLHVSVEARGAGTIPQATDEMAANVQIPSHHLAPDGHRCTDVHLVSPLHIDYPVHHHCNQCLRAPTSQFWRSLAAGLEDVLSCANPLLGNSPATTRCQQHQGPSQLAGPVCAHARRI